MVASPGKGCCTISVNTPLTTCLSTITTTVSDMLFPPICAGCHVRKSVLCEYCSETLQSVQFSRNAMPHQHTHAAYLETVYALFPFQSVPREIIHDLKYQGNTRIAAILSEYMIAAYRTLHIQADTLIPVPLHRERERARGYNQSIMLAYAISNQVHIPFNTKTLLRIRATQPQAGLENHMRQGNVEKAFACVHENAVTGKRVLLIDDVCTTGATLNACAQTLRKAGASSVKALVLARPV